MNNLTIAIVDTAYYTLAAKSLDLAVEVTGAKEVLVLSDKNFYPGSHFVKIDEISNKRDYSYLMLKELGKHINTDHFLVVQYDGMPIDTNLWTNDFLKYDYIGAPWPWGDPRYRVGNGGFSLRSRKLSDLCLDDRLVFDPPGYGDNNYMEDTHICNLYRNWLESQGINYAPLQLASKFSAEIPGGRFSTFGFHGTLCLPFYLSDQHLEFYIDQLTPRMLTDPSQIRIAFGLFRAERYEHLEHYMEHTTKLVPNFKEVLLAQFPQDKIYFPEFNLVDLENLLINY